MAAKKEAYDARARAKADEKKLSDEDSTLAKQARQAKHKLASPLYNNWVGQVDAFDAVADEMAGRVKTDTLERLELEEQRAYGERRARAWSFLCYPESMDPDALGRVEAMGLVGAFSPLHELDCWPDGTPKKAHFHGLFYFTGKKTYAQVKALCDSLGFVLPEPIEDLRGYCRYMCHMDIDPEHIPTDAGKVHYDTEQVRTFGGFDYLSFTKMSETTVVKSVQLLEGVIRDEHARTGEWFVSYADFKDFIAAKRPELAYVVNEPRVSVQISRYIGSRARAVSLERQNARLKGDVERLDGMLSMLAKALGYDMADVMRRIDSDFGEGDD